MFNYMFCFDNYIHNSLYCHSFLHLWIRFNYLHPAWRASFSISPVEDLLATYSLSFCYLRVFLFYPHFWKIVLLFIKFCVGSFLLSISNMSSFWVLSSVVSFEKTTINLIGVFLDLARFLLLLLSRFSLYLSFNILCMISTSTDIFAFILLETFRCVD